MDFIKIRNYLPNVFQCFILKNLYCAIMFSFCRSSHIWKYGKFTHDGAHPQDRLVTVKKAKGQLAFISSVFQHFAEHFKQTDRVLNTSEITAVIKSSMKP